MYLRDTAIILKSEPFREYDARVTMYGARHGKLVAVARAGKRFGSRALGHLEPFSEVEVMIAKGSSFDKLAVATLVRPRLALRERLSTLAIAGALVHLIDRLTHLEAGDIAIFYLLKETVDLAEGSTEEPSSERSRLLLAGASLKLLDVLGYAPQFDPSLHPLTLRVLRFLRARPLKEILGLTASLELFQTVSSTVEAALEHTPLSAEPHGVATVMALVG